MVNPAISPALTVRAIYSDAEIAMLESITRRLARGIDKPGWQVAKLADLTAVRSDLERQIAIAATQGVSAVSNGVATTYNRSANLAIADLPAGISVAFGQGGRRDAILALAREASGLLTATDPLILRSAVDVYRTVVANAAGTVLTGARTRLDAAQVELDRFAARGVTSFVDRAGRAWDMASYAEMATRTAVNRAGRAGYRDTLTDRGYDLVIVSGSVATCSLCAPWEGEVLSLNGETPGYPTVSDAEASGYAHPNSVFASTEIESIGTAYGGARGKWSGPVVLIRTARGARLTIGPNHPILTGRGWVKAGEVREGDKVIRRTTKVESGAAVHHGCPHFEYMPSSAAQVFDSLAAIGTATRGVPAARDLHGDARFIEGEIDIVRAYGALARERDLAFLGGSQPIKHSPFANVEAVRDLSRRHSLAVELDDVIHVEIKQWHGATAFDFATSSGTYFADGILVHNCGHREDVYLPGITRLDGSQVTADSEAEQEDNFNASQTQRYNERQIRDWKRREATAMTDEARALAGQKVKAWQKTQREHIAAHDDILRRQPSREQIVRAR